MGRITSSSYLSECEENIGLDRYININSSQRTKPPSLELIARTVEALLGAIWIDSQENMQNAKQAMQALGLIQGGVDL